MKNTAISFLLPISLLIASCGGGGGNSPSSAPPTQQPSTPPQIVLGVFPTTLSGTKDVDLFSDFTVTNLDKVSGVVMPLTWTVTGLPSGLTYDQTTDGSHMHINGRPSVSGTLPVHVVIKDSSPGQPTRVDTNIALTLDTAFKFSTLFVPSAIQNVPYSYQVPVANGVPPLNYQVTFGSFAPGLSFNTTTGLLNGTPTALRPYSNVNLHVTDSASPPHAIDGTLMGLEVVAPLSFSGQTITTVLGAPNLPFLNISGGVKFFKGRIIGGSLPPGISFTDNYSYISFVGAPTKIGTFSADFEITDSYNPPEVVTGTVKFYVNDYPPTVVASFPHAIVGVPYSYSVPAEHGTRPLTWNITGLPPGLIANSNGDISGTPTMAGLYQSVQLNVSDSSLPNPNSGYASGIIRVKPASTGRNDSIATATPVVTNNSQQWIHFASLSPYAKSTGVAQPDQDFYQLTVAPSATLTVLVEPLQALRGVLATSFIDPVLEFQDSSGTRLTNCRLPGSTTFSAACMNDDIDPGVNHASQLEVQNTTASDMTVYVRVLDWGGRARPDFGYRMSISGAK